MMMSRKKIISRSQSDLDYSRNNGIFEPEEDVWYDKDKLYQIWGKIICMERNRRIAKAYSRVPVLSVTGADYGFDGYKIGLNGFDNPMRDSPTKTVKRHIGKGVRLKMDELGNIIIKRISNCDVFVRGWDKESTSVSDEIVELNGELEFDKSVKLFDMKKFQSGIARELRSAYPDRRKLESQCICAIAFVKDAPNVLDLCSWVLLINIVALELLKSRFPTMNYNRVVSHDREKSSSSSAGPGQQQTTAPKFVSILEQQGGERGDRGGDRGGGGGSGGSAGRSSGSEEDPYSLSSSNIPSMVRLEQQEPRSRGDRDLDRRGLGGGGDRGDRGSGHSSGNSSTGSKSKQPPELPPRDYNGVQSGGKVTSRSKNKSKKASKDEGLKNGSSSTIKQQQQQQPNQTGQQQSQQQQKSSKKEGGGVDKSKKVMEFGEDPYYCGLQARVPNFGAGATQHHPHQLKSPGGGVPGLNATLYGQHRGGGGGGGHDMRKSQSIGYLNSLFNPSSTFRTNKNFNSNKIAKGSSHYSYYDSSLESDAYGISTSSGSYDIYAPLTGTLFGRPRGGVQQSKSSSYVQGHHVKTMDHRNGAKISSHNGKAGKGEPTAFSYAPQRYATGWDEIMLRSQPTS